MGDNGRGTVIVGASLAGLRVAEGLRKLGDTRPIDLFGAEPHLPYDRPPLSKGVLTAEQSAGDTQFRTADELRERGIELHLGEPARGLDTERGLVMVGDAEVSFDQLVIATGARARTIAGADHLAGVHTIRTLDDALRIRHRLTSASHVVVIGAGFIGAEVASSARKLGIDVTVVEAMASPLVRSVGEQVGAACASLHSEYGTKLLCGVGVAELEGESSVRAVVLADGTRIEADLVVAGIGVVPNVEWLEGSGVKISNGVECDEYLCTSAPNVYALGDIAMWTNPRYGESMRIEHWTTTVEQAMVVAHNVMNPADRVPCEAIPYFWSDQYGHRIQFAGRSNADEIVELDSAGARYVALYRRGDRLIGALTIDGTPLLMQLRGRMMRSADEWAECVEFAATFGR